MSWLMSLLNQDWFREVLAWLAVAAIAGAPCIALYLLVADRSPGLLPPRRRRAVPWTGLEVGAAFFLVFLLCQPFMLALLTESRFYRNVYGPQFPRVIPQHPATEEDELTLARMVLWEEAFVVPLQVAGVLVLFRLASDTRPYQLGLHASRWAENLVCGYLGWLLLTPAVLVLNFLVDLLLSSLVKVAPEEHPLAKMTELNLASLEWGLLAFVTVVAAPLREELMFRGVLQPWLVRRPWRGPVVLAIALAVALVARAEKLLPAVQHYNFTVAAYEFLPAAFILAMLPGYLLAGQALRRWVPEPGAARAIYATALLFASVHSGVWPTPIALFPLGLGLGLLAYRTQSLVGPVLMHGVFNGVACMTLVLAELLRYFGYG